LFNSFINCLVQIGETSGTLELILQQIAKLLTKSLQIRHQIKQALFYPMTILLVSLVVCLLMLIFIVPRFAEFFHDVHTQLPLITLIMLRLSDWIRTYYAWELGGTIGVILCLKYSKFSFLFRQRLKHLTYKLPFIHQWLDRFFILHFVKNLSIVYASGMSITEGLKLMTEISDYPAHQQTVLKLRSRLLTGKQLNISMKFCLIFPPIVIHMVRIGEESGALLTMLSTIEQLYETELDRIITKMNLLLEPLIMVILGVLIGGVVIAMYLPIFRIGIAI
jgi:type IV pilus assembly protein PilC